MGTSLGTTCAKDVMTTNLVTVSPTDKMEDLAKVLEKNDINSAPVLDETGRCVGMISNHDLAEYEAARIEVSNELRHGQFFDQARYGEGPPIQFPGICFNEVRCHMSKTLESAHPDDPVSKVARTMLRKHLHHVVILDDQHELVGIVSSLDILGHILGEPVTRNFQLESQSPT